MTDINSSKAAAKAGPSICETQGVVHVTTFHCYKLLFLGLGEGICYKTWLK